MEVIQHEGGLVAVKTVGMECGGVDFGLYLSAFVHLGRRINSTQSFTHLLEALPIAVESRGSCPDIVEPFVTVGQIGNLSLFETIDRNTVVYLPADKEIERNTVK